MQHHPLASKVRDDFPILKREINDFPLAYLDNASTTQKPQCVIDSLLDFYSTHNSNVSRGVYTLAEEATEIYEEGRENIAKFIGATDSGNIIFTSGSTESINLVASAWAKHILKTGDRIIVTEMEHHSNLVPWQMAAQASGAELVYWPITSEAGSTGVGLLELEELEELLTDSVKLLAVTAVSNVLGTVNPIAKIVEMAHERGIPVLVDAAQAVARMPIDVSGLDCDFLAFSGHKVYGPTGIGVLYAKKERLDEMLPFQGGGGMIRQVGRQSSTWADSPQKFEAGTPNVADVICFSAAIDYLTKIGMDNVRNHEIELTKYALEKMSKVKGLVIYGPKDSEKQGGVISFNFEDVHPHDVATIVDKNGVAIRSGHHCAQVLMEKLNVAATNRASFYIYTTKQEIDTLINSLEEVAKVFKL